MLAFLELSAQSLADGYLLHFGALTADVDAGSGSAAEAMAAEVEVFGFGIGCSLGAGDDVFNAGNLREVKIVAAGCLAVGVNCGEEYRMALGEEGCFGVVTGGDGVFSGLCGDELGVHASEDGGVDVIAEERIVLDLGEAQIVDGHSTVGGAFSGCEM